MLAQALTYTRSLVAELSPPILRESRIARRRLNGWQSK